MAPPPCTHFDTIRNVVPGSPGCFECLAAGRRELGAPPPLPAVRPCRLLRQLSGPSCHQALLRDTPSHREVPRARRGLVLVLYRSGGLRARRRTSHEHLAQVTSSCGPWNRATASEQASDVGPSWCR